MSRERARRAEVVTAAIAQAAPEPSDLAASLDKLEHFTRQAANEGAALVVFGETWIGGYPAWLDVCSDVALWDHGPTAEAFAELRRSSLVVADDDGPSPECRRLGQLAAELGIVLALGANERVDVGPGNRTLYNSILVFDEQGELALHHRKLVPTYTERLVWGPGDGHGLRPAKTGLGRIGGLVCWEHWMPLARQALHRAGEDIHLALWPTVKELHQVASRHYAFEARSFVLAAGSILGVDALPQGLELAESVDEAGDDDGLLLRGGSAIYGPDGELVAGPVWDEETLLLAELDYRQVDQAALTLDVSGHYSRPDVFEFSLRPSPPRE
jgi:predicted amidohydrolase